MGWRHGCGTNTRAVTRTVDLTKPAVGLSFVEDTLVLANAGEVPRAASMESLRRTAPLLVSIALI